MKNALVGFAVIAMICVGCKGRESASGGATETIAPAEPKPASTDSDAMTQTVDVEAGRSEAEGGTATTTQATGTTENPTTTVAPPSTTTH